MAYFKTLFIFLFVITSCKTEHKQTSKISNTIEATNGFVIAFGSCNNQVLPNTFWPEIKKNNPDVWIWGGDVIYSDTQNMAYLEQNYLKQKNNVEYSNFSKNIEILATWDDHDYGVNDGGTEYPKKAEAQQLFLDFIDVPKEDERRKQEGVYFSKDYNVNETIIKIIILDTRYFRTALSDDFETKKRYKPNTNSDGTVLGETQWKWLENQLLNSKASYTIIMSSIQFLSAEHGFETWGNMPNEIEKFENLLISTKTKNAIILSGDRHISEFSKKEIDSLKYPLIDFTSSGLTHSYSNFSEEPNKFRVGNVVSEKSYGILKIDLKTDTVILEIRGKNNTIYETITQNY
ncbi:alkaline phosphatase D family protein [uncultured Lutibacter sp.]|uniref:alkaline phosphatase D family protein n=1 Tax=uncultured Lutibacter sp. TaxID=437739 RepID=UPI00260F7AC3|nr:alkaline phosphatase D family protein [uncultured Lutibacter sp.]